MSKKINFVILSDTRENLPYTFKGYNCEVKRAGLKTGDYSIEGYENEICIERKSKADLYSSLGKGRERFEREFERMSKTEYKALVIEASLSSCLMGSEYSLMQPSAVINSCVSWGIRFNVQIYFADTRQLAECLVYRIMEKFLYNKNRAFGDIRKNTTKKGGEEIKCNSICFKNQLCNK